MKKRLAIIAILALTMVACANPYGPREGTGALLGAGAGALIGSQLGSGGGRVAAVALGSLAGALIGQDIGRTLDRADQSYMQRTAQSSLETLPTNQTSTWVNPDSGHSGSVTPTRTYQSADGQYCREYQQTVVIGGVEQQAYGRACRQADASWKISAITPETEDRTVQQRTVTRYIPMNSYPPAYWTAYYPGYYYPAYLWPFTSLSFSFSHFSGHHGHRGHWGHRGR